MRFKLTLNTEGNNNILPINYQFELASWIYKVLNRGNTEFADWLHQHGYQSGKQYFKFFTFSNLIIPRSAGKIIKDKIHLKSGQISCIVSFLPEKASESFIMGLFKDTRATLTDGNSYANFVVNRVEKLADPRIADTMSFQLISPMVISAPVEQKGKLYQKYLSPADEDFKTFFTQNLIRKFQARIKDIKNGRNDKYKAANSNNVSFKLSGTTKRKGITLKSNTAHPVKVIGYLFDFELHTSKEIIETGYYGGFGDMCSQGFGCAEIKGNNE